MKALLLTLVVTLTAAHVGGSSNHPQGGCGTIRSSRGGLGSGSYADLGASKLQGVTGSFQGGSRGAEGNC